MQFIDKTLEDVMQILKRDYCLSTQHNNRFYNKISPELKLLLFSIMLLIVNFIGNIQFDFLISFFLIMQIYFIDSKFRRVSFLLIIFNLIFLSLIFLPVLLTFNFDKNLAIGFSLKHFHLFITNVLRTETSLILLILLWLTTSWDKIIKSLKIFKVPDFIIEILLLNYRYIFYFLNLLNNINYSLKSRLIKRVNIRLMYKFISFKILLILYKSVSMAKQVNMVMISRSYNVRKF